MKKVNFIKVGLVALIIGSIFFVSCNNEDDNLNKPSKELVEKNSLFFKKLNDFNTDFKFRTATSGSLKKIDWKRIFRVAGADICGATVGYIYGVILAHEYNVQHMEGVNTLYACSASYCGAAASSAAGKTAVPDINPHDVNYGKLNIKIPNEYTAFSNVGIDHNNVIHKYFYNNGDIKEYYQNLDPESISLLNSNEFEKTCEVMKSASIEYASNDFDYNLLTQRLLDQRLFTDNMKIVTDMFLSTMFECNSPEDLETIINFYIDAVDKSGLKSDEKKALIVSFIVASESPFYLAGN